MRIDFGLAAPRHTVEQRDLFVAERLYNFGEGIILSRAERGGGYRLRIAGTIKAIDRPLLNAEDSLVDKSLEDAWCQVRALGELSAGYGSEGTVGIEPAREIKPRNESLLLTLRSAHQVEKPMQTFIIITFKVEFDESFSAGMILLDNFLVDIDDPEVEESIDDTCGIMYAGFVLDFGNAQATLSLEHGDDEHLSLGGFEILVRFKILIERDIGFRLRFETSGDGSLKDLTDRAEVILGNPIPELKLRVSDYGFGVEQSHYILDSVILRSIIMETLDDSRIILLTPKLDEHTRAHLQTVRYRVRYGVGERRIQWQREYNLGKHSAKITKVGRICS